MCEILILPPHALWEPWTDPPNPAGPDRELPYRILASRGYRYRRIDLFRWPWNPLAKSHSILRAIDPLRALRVLLLHRRADVVLSHFESAALLILLLRRLLRFRGKVIVFDVGLPGTSRLRDRILRKVLPRADLLVPLGRAQVAALLKMGARPGTIRPRLSGTSPEFFTDAGDHPDGYILSVGDDGSRDYSTLLAAVAGVDRRIVIRSRVVAVDPASHPNVEVLTRGVSSVDYRSLIAHSLLVVLPLRSSVHAGGVTSLLEAMSCGKPVIVSASPGIADYIQDGVNCRIVECGNAEQLRSVIEELINNPVERRRLGAGARQFVFGYCSAEREAVRIAEMVDIVLGKEKGLFHRNPAV